MHITPLEIYEKLVKAGDEWSDCNAAAEMLEENRKVLLSQLAAESNESSVAAREGWAMRQEEYKSHLKAMVTARKAANRAKVRFDSAKVYVDMLRTQAATERAANKVAP